MSIAIIQIDKERVPALRKVVKAMEAKIHIMTDKESYQEEVMIKLIEEGLKSEIVSKEKVKREFKKHGIDY